MDLVWVNPWVGLGCERSISEGNYAHFLSHSLSSLDQTV